MSSLDVTFPERSRAILQEAAEAGLNLIYKLCATHDVTGEVALGYSRISKAVRQNIAYEARLAEAQDAQDRATAERQAAERHKAEQDAVLKAQIQRESDTREIAERLIEAEPAERREHLFDELEDFFDCTDEDFDPERPLREVIALLCNDLEIDPDWAAFNEPWAAEMPALRLCGTDLPRAQTWTAEAATPPSGPRLTRPERAPPDG